MDDDPPHPSNGTGGWRVPSRRARTQGSKWALNGVKPASSFRPAPHYPKSEISEARNFKGPNGLRQEARIAIEPTFQPELANCPDDCGC